MGFRGTSRRRFGVGPYEEHAAWLSSEAGRLVASIRNVLTPRNCNEFKEPKTASNSGKRRNGSTWSDGNEILEELTQRGTDEDSRRVPETIGDTKRMSRRSQTSKKKGLIKKELTTSSR